MTAHSMVHSQPSVLAFRKQATRRHFGVEHKIRIVIASLCGADSIAERCRKEGINRNLYYRWSKECLGAGKKRFAGDTAREATSDVVKGVRAEACQLKEARAEVIPEIRLLKKRGRGRGARNALLITTDEISARLREMALSPATRREYYGLFKILAVSRLPAVQNK